MKELFQYLSANPTLLITFRLFLTAILTIAAYYLSAKLMNGLEKVARERTQWEGDEELVAFLKKPGRRLIVLIGAYYFLGYFSQIFGQRYELYLQGIFYVLIVVQLTLTLMGLVGKAVSLYSRGLVDRKILGGKEEFFPLLVRVAKIIIFFIALIIILNHFNQNVQSLVVSLGVGSLAIALAAQETLSNMIAGFVIMTDRPFRLGDRLKLASGEVGDVFEIGLRSTKIRTFDNTLIIVPNAEIVKEKVVNLSYPDSIIRVLVYAGVAYGTDIEKVKSIMEQVCRDHPKVLDDPAPSAYFLEFGDSSLNLRVTCRVPDWRDEWGISEDIRLEIYRRFNKEGIEIPFPQRVLWWGKPPENMNDEDKSDERKLSDNPERNNPKAE